MGLSSSEENERCCQCIFEMLNWKKVFISPDEERAVWIQRLWVQVPLGVRHPLFPQNIHSSVENECCFRIRISSVTFITKHYIYLSVFLVCPSSHLYINISVFYPGKYIRTCHSGNCCRWSVGSDGEEVNFSCARNMGSIVSELRSLSVFELIYFIYPYIHEYN